MLINALMVTQTPQRYDESFIITASAHRSVSAELCPPDTLQQSNAQITGTATNLGAGDQAQEERHSTAAALAPPERSPPVSQCDRESTRGSRNARAARQGAAAASARAARLASAAAGASEVAPHTASERAQGGGRGSDGEGGGWGLGFSERALELWSWRLERGEGSVCL